jgi:hypothetical protein
MSNTSIMRKFRTAGVAAGIFAIGAGIGWQFADLLFRGEPPLPMVASIQFEGGHPRQQSQPPRQEAVREPVSAPQQGATENRPPQSEEARLSEALKWAEKYRQQESQRTTTEALRWAAVVEQAKQFGQGREDVQKVIRAQVERERGQKNTARVALAAGVVQTDKTSDPVIVAVKARAEECTRACASKTAKKRATKRTAHRSQPRMHRTGGRPADTFICPLRWLEAALMEPFVERRGGRRHSRIMAAG